MRTNAKNFVKILQTSRRQISGQNSKFWQFWGLHSHIFAPINVKFCTGDRGNVSPLRGIKPIFGPLSKNNTGMAALR